MNRTQKTAEVPFETQNQWSKSSVVTFGSSTVNSLTKEKYRCNGERALTGAEGVVRNRTGSPSNFDDEEWDGPSSYWK